MDDIIDAAQVMFEEDGISQDTVKELREVRLSSSVCDRLNIFLDLGKTQSVLSDPSRVFINLSHLRSVSLLIVCIFRCVVALCAAIIDIGAPSGGTGFFLDFWGWLIL